MRRGLSLTRGAAGLALFVLAGGVFPSAGFALAKDEEVRYFPSYARWDKDRSLWRAELRGWVFEPEEGALARKMLMGSLVQRVPPDGDPALFESRLKLFLVDTEERKTLWAQWGKARPRRLRSKEEGELRWTDVLPAGPEALEGMVVPVRSAFQGRVFEGPVQLIGEEGLSVVSDIDDTVKISSVTDPAELWANTFYRVWRAVPGMADLYQTWADQKAVFHYVSNSPWPLEQPLRVFLNDAGFPAGTTHLRPFSLRESLLESMFDKENHHKRTVLERLAGDFPRRRFLLVGDSGERDPEIYGDFARAHPRQVAGIYIRRASTDGPDRYSRAFAGVERARWTVFDEPPRTQGTTP